MIWDRYWQMSLLWWDEDTEQWTRGRAMNSHDNWLTRPYLDDDPHGDHDEEERCPSCRCHWTEPCDKLCGCRKCREAELAESEPKDAA